jgi:hypothetical protein
MTILLNVASLQEKSSKESKENNLHSRDLTNFFILSILLIKTQVAKTKEIIKIDGCNVII